MTSSIPNYLNVKNDYAQLNDIVVTKANGQPGMRFGVSVELWFLDGWTQEKRKACLDICEDYFDMFKDNLDTFLNLRSGSHTKISGGIFPDHFQKTYEKSDEYELFTPTLLGSKEPIAQHQISTMAVDITRKDRKPLSYIRARFAPSWVAKNPSKIVGLVNRWSAMLGPIHGTCGITPLINADSDDADPELYLPLIKRFPGLDFINGKFGILARMERAIKGVNWLTILADENLAKLGGMDYLTPLLSSEITVFPFKSGIVIQAGAEPQIGDTNNNIWPEEYRMVNAALKPIRFEDYSKPLLKALPPLDPLDETKKWITRFDVKD